VEVNPHGTVDENVGCFGGHFNDVYRQCAHSLFKKQVERILALDRIIHRCHTGGDLVCFYRDGGVLGMIMSVQNKK
jgi:hypothetical protein